MNQPTRRSHIQQAPSLFSSLLPLFLLLLSLLLFSSPSSLLFVSSSFPGVPPHPDSVFLWNDGLQLDPAGLKLDLHFYNENTLQPGKKLVFTKGDRAYIFDVINWQVIGESSIAKVHRGEVPLWRVGYMDCVIQWPMSNAFYFFTGDRYFRGDSNADLSTNTWSSSLITLEWEGLPSNLHACINLGSTRAIFIYKDKIYHCKETISAQRTRAHSQGTDTHMLTDSPLCSLLFACPPCQTTVSPTRSPPTPPGRSVSTIIFLVSLLCPSWMISK